MTEGDARAWMLARVPRETFARLEQLVDVVRAEAQQQNLVAASTLTQMWSRHVVDSAQLLDLAPANGRWLDLGSGAGFPGLVVALIGEHPVTLAESRTRRAAFLADAIERLGLTGKAEVIAGRIEMAPARDFEIISARAFAPLDRLFASAQHLASEKTVWVLPKGRGAQAELDAARGSWQGAFRTVQSITDPEATIIVADQVRPIGGGSKTGSRR